MNLQDNLKKVLDELKEELKGVNVEFEDLAHNEDVKWLEELETSYNSEYTYKEIVKEAKTRRLLVINELNNTIDSNKQATLAEKLVKLNKVIAMYENKFTSKEERKNNILFDDKKAKMQGCIKESVNKAIESINSELNDVKNKEQEILNKYASSSKNEKSNLILELDKINSNIESLSKQKEEFEKLLTYNGKLLISVSTGDSVIDEYYKLIVKNGLDMNAIKKPNTNNDNDDSLEEATKLVEKAEETKDEEDIKKALDAVSKLDDSDEKTNLINRINNIKTKDDALEEATKLVEKAEETKDAEDIKKALETIKKVKDEEERKKLVERIRAIKVDTKKTEFVELLNKINEDIDTNNKVSREDVVSLREKYQELDDVTAGMYSNDVKRITSFYNNQYENKLKSRLDEDDIEKHSIKDYIIETFGKPFALLLGTSFVKKINNKRLAKRQEKYDNAPEEKKEKALNKLNKVKKTIGDLAVVSGCRLFKSRNAINKLKPRLYRNELTEKQVGELAQAQDNFEYRMIRGLDKKANNTYNLTNKEGILNIFNQYAETMAVANNYEEVYKDATKLLDRITTSEETENILSINEVKAIINQLCIINSYRKNEDDAIYEFDYEELGDVVKYYDENVKTQNHELTFMK